MSYRLGIDTGGTFTDIVLLNEKNGDTFVLKVPSTPNDPSEAVINGILDLQAQTGINVEDISFFVHGSTVATNTLLEQNGSKTALITTKGFKDVLEIGRQARPKLYDFRSRRKPALVPRELRVEVDERIKSDGDILKPINKEEVKEIILQLKDKGVGSITVCLINSFINPIHEQIIKEIIEDNYPKTFVSISSEVMAEFKEYERTTTVVANGYVMPKMKKYINQLKEKLETFNLSSKFFIMQSNGGIITADNAMLIPAKTVLSGPAGGILAGLHIVETTQYKNLITIDMGGTSLDTALIKDGQPQYTTMSEVGGIPIKLPMIEMHTIGSGGGSIAWLDEGGALRVGPKSAGAVPGPVCYNKGGMEPTVTDANVILGRLNPQSILGGKMEMNLELAKKIMKEKIANPLGISVEEAAEGVLRVVNANMVRGIRVISIEKGYDPRGFSLVAFGGAGPVHAMDIANELGCSEIIIPPNPGLNSAMGMLIADARQDYVQTILTDTNNLNLDEVNKTIKEMINKAEVEMEKEGFTGGNLSLFVSMDLRYVNQAYEIEIPTQNTVLTKDDIQTGVNSFHERHQEVYGFRRDKEIVELVNIRLTAIGKMPRVNFNRDIGNDELKKIIAVESRDVFFDGKFYKTNIYRKNDLFINSMIEGPSIIEQLDTTIIIGPNQYAKLDRNSNLIVKSN